MLRVEGQHVDGRWREHHEVPIVWIQPLECVFPLHTVHTPQKRHGFLVVFLAAALAGYAVHIAVKALVGLPRPRKEEP